MEGTTPKFDVVDEDGVKWKVKLGVEARPEVAASRLVWAVGYFAAENYFVPVLHIQNMKRLRRGGRLVSRDGVAHNGRLKRHLTHEKNIGDWSWARNPFTGTREWYGLRVLMAVLNNWDLKDENNAIVQVRGSQPEQRYLVSDLGATFGRTGLSYDSKGNLEAYTRSKWINQSAPDLTDFNVPSVPAFDYFFRMPELPQRIGLLWIGRRIPTSDARWMGRLLARLSAKQIRDAFRAADYTPREVEEFSRVVERRIVELENL
jgi:hypothetical protein